MVVVVLASVIAVVVAAVAVPWWQVVPWRCRGCGGCGIGCDCGSLWYRLWYLWWYRWYRWWLYSINWWKARPSLITWERRQCRHSAVWPGCQWHRCQSGHRDGAAVVVVPRWLFRGCAVVASGGVVVVLSRGCRGGAVSVVVQWSWSGRCFLYTTPQSVPEELV